METLLGAAEVADAQQLQGPLVDRIEAMAFEGLGIAAETEGGEGLDADALASETVGAELVAGLQEGQGHALGLLTGAVDAGDAVEDLEAGAAGAWGGIEQDRLTGGHAHGTGGIVGKEAITHRAKGGALLRMALNLEDPPALLQAILNSSW
jgi:hypothetical protein